MWSCCDTTLHIEFDDVTDSKDMKLKIKVLY